MLCVVRATCVCAPAAALTETEYAFLHLNTEKEVAQAVRNAFVKKVVPLPIESAILPTAVPLQPTPTTLLAGSV